MNIKLTAHLVGVIALIVSVAIMLSALVGLVMGDTAKDSLTLFLTGFLCALILTPIILALKPKNEKEKKSGLREGFAIVTLSWIGASLAGMLPFIFVTGMTPWDAFFEAASGITTTGASVIDNTLVLMNGKTSPTA